MTIGGYVDPALSGAGGAANVAEGIQEGNLKQVASGAHQGLGAYTAASNAMAQHAFEQAYASALKMGLQGTAATQYANQAAQGVGLTGASAIGEWLPWIGAGLAVYNLATGNIHGGQQGLAAASFASMPWTGPFGFAAGAFYSIPKLLGRRPDYDKHIYLHEPDLELIHQDEEGNYYLYDKSIQRGGLALAVPHTDTLNSQEYGKGSLIKYNPETNEISTGKIGYHTVHKPGSKKSKETQLTIDQVKELLETGQTTYEYEHYPRLKNKDQTPETRTATINLADTPWSDFNPEIKAGFGGRGSKSFYNMPSLQAQLYNKVLIPGGLAPIPETQSITAGGQQYQADSSGAVFDSNNKIVGQINNSGQIQTFQKENNRIGYGDIGEATSLGDIGASALLGTVDNWDQIKSTFSDGLQGSPNFGTSGSEDSLLNALESSGSGSSSGTGGFGMSSDASMKESTKQAPAQREAFQVRLMDSLMSALFPGGSSQGLEDWMKANWESRKQTGADYLTALEGESARERALHESIANQGATVSLDDFSIPFTTGTQRRAQNILAEVNDAEAKAKALYGEQYGIPYGPETEYFKQITSPMAQWAENLAWGLPDTQKATSIDLPEQSFVSQVTDFGKAGLGLAELLSAIGGTETGGALGQVIGGAAKDAGGWLGGLFDDTTDYLGEMLKNW